MKIQDIDENLAFGLKSKSLMGVHQVKTELNISRQGLATLNTEYEFSLAVG